MIGNAVFGFKNAKSHVVIFRIPICVILALNVFCRYF